MENRTKEEEKQKGDIVEKRKKRKRGREKSE